MHMNRKNGIYSNPIEKGNKRGIIYGGADCEVWKKGYLLAVKCMYFSFASLWGIGSE